jgi:tetratricopeptide (TPR) repeat protein
MHALSLALALVAAGPSAPAPAVAPVPVSAPAAAAATPLVAPSLISADPASPPAAPAAPTAPVDAAASRAATPAPSASAPAPPAAPAPAPASPAAAEPPAAPQPPPLPQAAVEKLGQGDRAFLERDYRNALFAYQDVVYLAPKNPVARVKLGRAYLALRYATRAAEQAEVALAVEPANADARRLLEDARSPAARPVPPATSIPASAPAAPAATASVESAAAAPAQPRVYRFTPEPAAAPSEAPPPSSAAAREPAAAPARAEPASAESARTVAAVAIEDAPPAAPAPGAAPGRSAGRRYREALALLQSREFGKADETLTDAIAIDPRLAVAHAARASARFGLGRYREAATDYRTSLALDPGLGTPLYGLAECYRVLGDSRSAAEMYERYARSGAADVREDLRAIASKRAQELR